MKKLEPLINEEMYVLVSPDGNPQVMTLAPDLPMCIGVCKLQAQAGITEPTSKLLKKGYTFLPVKVTIEQNGSEKEGYQRAADAIKKATE